MAIREKMQSTFFTDSLSGLTYQTKSFPFELKKLMYDVAKKEGIFIGLLIVPPEDEEIFNKKEVLHRRRRWPGPRNLRYWHGHIPLFRNHTIPLGRLRFGFITYNSKRDPIQKWDLQVTGHLMSECQEGIRLYARLKKKGREVIRKISVGYDMVAKEDRYSKRFCGNKIYEASIEGEK